MSERTGACVAAGPSNWIRVGIEDLTSKVGRGLPRTTGLGSPKLPPILGLLLLFYPSASLLLGFPPLLPSRLHLFLPLVIHELNGAFHSIFLHSSFDLAILISEE